MTEMTQLWKRRSGAYWNEAIRYLRLIFNSGFMFSIYVAFIFGAYYYSVLLDWLSPAFPSALVIAVITTFLLVRSPVRTFMKEPDLVFLLPLESRMEGYFRKSVNYSFALQSGTLIFVLFLLGPLYFARISESYGMFFLTAAMVLVVKYWNTSANWEEMHLQTKKARLYSVMLRTAVTYSVMLLLLRQAPVYFLIIAVLFMPVLTWFYYRPLSSKHPLKWEWLLEIEESRLMSFYRIANLFTDVPKIRNRIKPRRVLSPLFNNTSFSKKAVFTQLFYKTFLRSNDFFGIYVRLLVVGGVIIYFLPAGYSGLIALLLFLHISGMQLLTLWRHPSSADWEDIYPISNEVRKKSFLKVVFSLLAFKSVIFGVVMFLNGMMIAQGLLGIAAGIAFSAGFSKVYLDKKINKMA